MKGSEIVTILYGSKSKEKLAAISDAISKVFKGAKVEMILYNVGSGINAQPIGHEETLKGAVNRLEFVKLEYEKANDNREYDYVLGIESGIIKMTSPWLVDENNPTGEQLLDIAFIALEHKSSKIKLVQQSSSVDFPVEAVNEARNAGFKNKTAGDFIKKVFDEKGLDTKSYNSKDPHDFLLDNYTNRSNIISNALEIGFARIQAKINSEK